jgi:CRISPR-associated endonuclease/helicase Cas3
LSHSAKKNALKKTRRVLDAFANRIGDNTWQTLITEDGLLTVKKMLRQTASKSTAVSCHWIRSRARSQFLRVVGNKNKFNSLGVVPVNSTQKEIFLGERRLSPIYEIISLASAIAGLFHDFGKSNPLFQNKLDKTYKGKTFEPYRHEWLSTRLFQSFTKGKSDTEWLVDLSNVDNNSEKFVLNNLVRDGIDKDTDKILDNLAPLAKLVSWLIVTHHRLPVYPSSNEFTNASQYRNIDSWLDNEFDVLWNATNHVGNFSQKEVATNWTLKNRTPFNSALWQAS